MLAGDLRREPLETAKRNCARFGVDGRMEFLLSDGLEAFTPGSFDTLVMAGMGGDLIIHILRAAPWLADSRYTLILQPQSGGQDLRAYLAAHGFSIQRESLARDGRFLYSVLLARHGAAQALTPGQQYCSPALLASGSPELGAYLARVEAALRDTVRGIEQAQTPEEGKLAYYRQALAEIQEMIQNHAEC